MKSWYTIKNTAAGADVSLFDEIGHFGITAQDFITDLAGVKGPVSLHLNSPGGEIFDGLAIYNALKSRPDVSVTVEGLAASIASVIAMAASPGKLGIAKRGSMMIHDGFTQVTGNAKDMADAAALLDKQSDNIAGVYSDRTGKSQDFWRGQMKNETWYTGAEAVDAGLADHIADAPVAQASWDKASLSDVGTAIVAKYNGTVTDAAAYTPKPYSHESWEPVQCPVCQKFNDTDAQYCGQCGTKLAGRTDVTVTNQPGKAPKQARAKKPAKGKPSAAAASVDNSPWDASKVWAAGAKADHPAAFYGAVCAGRKAGNPNNQAAWALPYRYTPTSPPNADAVRNALSRLPQTDDLTNKAQAQSLLEGLMKKINPDYSSDSMDLELLAQVFTASLGGRQ